MDTNNCECDESNYLFLPPSEARFICICFYKIASKIALTLCQLFHFIQGTLDTAFVKQWQMTLFIFNVIGLLLSLLMYGPILWYSVDLEHPDWSLAMIVCTLVSAIVMAGLTKRYLNEYVHVDKI